MEQTILTRSAYMWTRILTAPFWAIYNILPIILYKDLGASPLQITLIYALKPFVSIFSIYWSAAIARRPHLLVPNIIGACIIGHLPFLFCPFIDNPWFFIAAFSLYMIQARGVLPAWMEVLKLNIPPVSREKVFAYGSICGNIGNVMLPIVFGWMLDGYEHAWRLIFPLAAATSFIAIIFQLKMTIPNQTFEREAEENWLYKPWVRSWKLLKGRRDFWLYQLGFMLGGVGLMVMQPALPHYFHDVLGLTYTELAIAFSFVQSFGVDIVFSLMGKMDESRRYLSFQRSCDVDCCFISIAALYSADESLLPLYRLFYLWSDARGK